MTSILVWFIFVSFCASSWMISHCPILSPNLRIDLNLPRNPTAFSAYDVVSYAGYRLLTGCIRLWPDNVSVTVASSRCSRMWLSIACFYCQSFVFRAVVVAMASQRRLLFDIHNTQLETVQLLREIRSKQDIIFAQSSPNVNSQLPHVPNQPDHTRSSVDHRLFKCPFLHCRWIQEKCSAASGIHHMKSCNCRPDIGHHYLVFCFSLLQKDYLLCLVTLVRRLLNTCAIVLESIHAWTT